jgi:hypothetical protein
MPSAFRLFAFPCRVVGAHAAFAAVLLAACNPTFNWRDVRPESTRLAALMPCKPDQARRPVAIGGRPVEVALMACDAGGLTFAIAVAEAESANQAPLLAAAWRQATLANLRATPAAPAAAGTSAAPPARETERTLALQGADPRPAPAIVQAQGRRPDGSEVTGQAAYFSQGLQVFQAVVYGREIAPEVSDTFFSSLKFE